MSEVASAVPRPAILKIGQKLGNYRIVRQLGEGGMGAVFEAVHEVIERRAAVKVLHPELSLDPHLAARFLNEARAVNLVRHPGLVESFEFGVLDSGGAYIIMEYLEGETLSAYIARTGGRTSGQALTIARQIAQAVAAAHQKDIIHRDLKPANVMLVPDFEKPGRLRAKVLDFGLAKMTTRSDGAAHTQTGAAVGTPQYMAPEQCMGLPNIDGKADVYALGLILYQMLAGRLPYDGEHPFDFMNQHVRGTPRPLREAAPDMAEEVADLVHRLLAKDPAERPTMAEVAAELERLEVLYPVTLSAPDLAFTPTLAAPVQATPPPAKAGPAAPARRRYGIAAAALLLVLVSTLALQRMANRAPPPPVVEPGPPTIRWSLTSTPSGAEVVRADGKILGTTPWQMERPAGPGETEITLRRPGHAPKTIALAHGASMNMNISLDPLPPPRQAEPARPGTIPDGKAGVRDRGKRRRGPRPQGGGDEVKLLD